MPDLDIPSYDAMVEDHKQRKWQEVNDIERQRQDLSKQIGSLSSELVATQQELGRVHAELNEFVAKRDHLKAQWDATVKNVQVVFDAREKKIEQGEQEAAARLHAAQDAELATKHAQTILRESVENISNQLQAFQHQIETAVATLVSTIQQLT